MSTLIGRVETPALIYYQHFAGPRDTAVMAAANVDLVRSIYGAWARGDFSPAAWAQPDIEFVRVDGPSPGRWSGTAGLVAGTRDWLSAWQELRVEAVEYRALDEERVLVLVHSSGRGKASGLEVGQLRTSEAHLFHVRDGKVTRLVHYFDRERALTDLGLKSDRGFDSEADR